MTKDQYVFYFDRLTPGKGIQSAHLGVVIVLRREMPTEGGGTRPYYRFGVAVKHPKDKLPFIKREGRDTALLRAARCTPIFTLSNLISAVRYELLHMTLVGQDDKREFDMKRLLSRMEFVVSRPEAYANQALCYAPGSQEIK